MDMEMEMMGSLKHQTEALKLLHELHSNRKVRNNSNTNSTTVLIAERARESLLARLVDILSQIISIEQDLMRSLSGEVRCFLRHKDSVDLKNICLRMALSESGHDSDRNLKELRICLQILVNNLLSAARDHNHLSSTGATRRLMGISITLPDI
ncbi:leukemia-associated protein 7 [Ictalurus furcatus]|uniref:leukemia-associated protein 7 n=1 Tax=Ictalurus furcatus TaxID=66913 RepID=UPI0023507346|nr:leukemia-associated protein 7 [Ictalurus furcatus]